MILRHPICIIDGEEQLFFNEIASIQWAAHLSLDEIQKAILFEWRDLQEVPSYVESLLEDNRGLIEGVATQS